MAGSTQRVIRKTFMELLEERPLNEITVKLIVERCGINRKTFYNHYRDIPDLMEKIHKRAALHIYRSVGRDVYVESTLKLCDYLVRTYLAKVDGAAEMDAEDYEILVRLYRGQLFGLITEWMMQGMQSDILQNFHRVCALRSGMTEELIRRANLRP